MNNCVEGPLDPSHIFDLRTFVPTNEKYTKQPAK